MINAWKTKLPKLSVSEKHQLERGAFESSVSYVQSKILLDLEFYSSLAILDKNLRSTSINANRAYMLINEYNCSIEVANRVIQDNTKKLNGILDAYLICKRNSVD